MSETAKALSIGSVVGGTTLQNQPWREAIKELSQAVANARTGVDVPLKVNVVFHVPGDIAKPDYLGVRTGTFSRARSLLMVQVALPEQAPPDVMAYLHDALRSALEEASHWAQKRRVTSDIPKLRDVLARL